MATLAQIGDFLASRRIVIAGVSRSPSHFTRVVFREFRNRGYEVVPVNPVAAEIEGIPCFPRIADVSPPAEAALILTPAAASEPLALDFARSGIRKIWIYRRLGKPLAETAGAISGECPLMYLSNTSVIHRVHGFCRKLTGSYPK